MHNNNNNNYFTALTPFWMLMKQEMMNLHCPVRELFRISGTDSLRERCPSYQ